ncbi:MAG: prepilin-type N-terminal cleavage/methylation domain-containing protein [Waltera sp.]
MLKKLKKNKKKGFTLVELIVVLVILAILAALLIPALTGYINKAKEKSITAETRSAVMAAQTLVDEEYGAQKLDATEEIGYDAETATGTAGDGKITQKEIQDLAEVEGTIASVTIETGKVKGLVYKNSGKQCTYDKTKSGTSGAYVVVDAPKK